MNNDTTDIPSGIEKVIASDIFSYSEADAIVNVLDALHWLNTESAVTHDPQVFLAKYWRYIQQLHCAYDIDDHISNDAPIWGSHFMEAARHVGQWDLINSQNDLCGADDNNPAVQRAFSQWTKDLHNITETWRLAVCCEVEKLFKKTGGMSKDGNFEMTSSVDATIATLDEPHRTILETTGGYSPAELQGILEDIQRRKSRIPEVSAPTPLPHDGLL